MRFLFHSLKAALFLAGLALGAALPAGATSYYIQSKQNGKYAGFYRGYLAARFDRNHAQAFEAVELANGRVAFQDPASGRYLRAGAAGADLNLLEWGDVRLDEWEMFDNMVVGGYTALRSVANGKYVRAGIGQQTYFGAVSDHTLGWEQFRLVEANAAAPENTGWLRDMMSGGWRVGDMLDQNGRALGFSTPRLEAVRFIIQRNGSFRLTAGCNTVTGQIDIVRARTGEVRFSNILSTRLPRASCNADFFDLEQTMADLLEDIRSVERLDNNRLMLRYANGARYGFILRRR